MTSSTTLYARCRRSAASSLVIPWLLQVLAMQWPRPVAAALDVTISSIISSLLTSRRMSCLTVRRRTSSWRHLKLQRQWVSLAGESFSPRQHSTRAHFLEELRNLQHLWTWQPRRWAQRQTTQPWSSTLPSRRPPRGTPRLWPIHCSGWRNNRSRKDDSAMTTTTSSRSHCADLPSNMLSVNKSKNLIKAVKCSPWRTRTQLKTNKELLKIWSSTVGRKGWKPVTK